MRLCGHCTQYRFWGHRLLIAPQSRLLVACVSIHFVASYALGQDFEAVFQRARENRLEMTRHGGVPRDLRPLILARDLATPAIISEVARYEKGKPRYVEALFAVLGTVKDPATIAWLRARVSDVGDQSGFVYGAWLSMWLNTPIGTFDTRRYLVYRWLSDEKREAWRPFILELYQRAPSARDKSKCLRALTYCFHDDATLRILESMESEVGGEELLIVQVSLNQHGRKIALERLRSNIDVLRQMESNAPLLRFYAAEMRHEAFIPALLDMLEGPARDFAIDSLQMITLLSGPDAPEDWREWWSSHNHECSAEWVTQAGRRADARLHANDTEYVASRLSDGYFWADSRLAPHVRRWLKYNALHPAIADWVVKSYEESDRSSLKEIADAVVRESWQHIGWFAQEGLANLDFVSSHSRKWDEWWRQ